MEDDDLLGCIAWVALDFEICTSIFPSWRFKVADAAATGVHVALLLGARHPDRRVAGTLGGPTRIVFCYAFRGGGRARSGGGAQVLGSPIKALKYLVRELARYGGEPLRAGEFVTTGTLTQALPAGPGDRWRAEAKGAEFADIEIQLA